jgi:hypothetical protein
MVNSPLESGGECPQAASTRVFSSFPPRLIMNYLATIPSVLGPAGGWSKSTAQAGCTLVFCNYHD